MRKNLVKCVFGSHLYGLSTPSSDHDYKIVYMPSLSDILLHGPDSGSTQTTGSEFSKNTSDDVDIESFSFGRFMRLAAAGEMIALDMLHARPKDWIESSTTWVLLHEARSKFYTKNMKAYLGYVRKQTAKYGIKGSRLNAMQSALDFMAAFDDKTRLDTFIEDPNLPLDADYLKRGYVMNGDRKFQTWEICAKQFMETVTVREIRQSVQKTMGIYGARAKAAQASEGVDWKAISHAFRAGYQLRDLYVTGDYKYPLAESSFLLDVKLGKLEYPTLAESLESLMAEVNELSEKSSYPTVVDKEWMEEFMMDVYVSVLNL